MNSKGQVANFMFAILVMLLTGLMVVAAFPIISVTWGLNEDIPSLGVISGLINYWPILALLAVLFVYLWNRQPTGVPA